MFLPIKLEPETRRHVQAPGITLMFFGIQRIPVVYANRPQHGHINAQPNANAVVEIAKVEILEEQKQ